MVSCLDKNHLGLRVDLVQCSIQVLLLDDDLTLTDLKLVSGQFLIRLSCAVKALFKIFKTIRIIGRVLIRVVLCCSIHF